MLDTPLKDPPDRDRGSRAHRAADTIREMILARRLEGGDILSEEKLAQLLQISRTPVREALFLLQSEGLIQKQVSQPFRVRLVSNKEYFQSMRLRELLEGEAVGMAIDRLEPAELDAREAEMESLRHDPAASAEAHWSADEALHGMIADACDNDVMGRMIRTLRVTTRLYELSGLPSRFRPDT
ncbi:MAG: GntR family transcriptional regulator, partial [Geminicoccaceae bacterium]|nr:GntR family transcriptional regulator [Geminicoccaceae bacterium]